jgi:SCAMP family
MTPLLYDGLFIDLLYVSTGSAGIIQTIQRFSHRALVAGILGIIATVGWAVQGLGNAFYYRQVIFFFFIKLLRGYSL